MVLEKLQTVKDIEQNLNSLVNLMLKNRPIIVGKFVRLKDHEEKESKGWYRFVLGCHIEQFEEAGDEFLAKLFHIDQIVGVSPCKK